MAGKLDNKQEHWLEVRRDEINKELFHVEDRINEINKKVRKQKGFLDNRIIEIKLSKEKIEELLDMESDSKTQIAQHIDMLTWLIESIDDSINELKDSMITNIDDSIKENSKSFKEFIIDLQEVMQVLGTAKKIKDGEALEDTIISIISTIEMFSDNIDESITIMSDTIQTATKVAVEESGKDFDAFVEDIHQVFETFNTTLQKLKLTNSIKKYVELEKIYQENNRILTSYEELLNEKVILEANQKYLEEELRFIKDFGVKEDKKILTQQRDIIDNSVQDLKEDIVNIRVQIEEYSEKLEDIEIEKSNLRSFFEALSDEIVDNQTVATETYNVMYNTLDNIHSAIPFIKNELRDTSTAAIFDVIAEFIKGIKTFGKIVDIIKKVQKVDPISKKQQYLAKIESKSKLHLKKIKAILSKISSEVKERNKIAINESFKEFNEFIEIFKKKFYIIEGTVSAITLGTSEQLIKELQELFDDQISYRSLLVEKKSFLSSYEELLNKYDKKLQSLDNSLKLYDKKEDRTQRKVIKITKSIINVKNSLENKVLWNVENASIVDVKDLKIFEMISKSFSIQPNDDSKQKIFDFEDNEIYQFEIGNLKKRQDQNITYNLIGFEESSYDLIQYSKNISPIKRYRYRNIAQPVKMDIIENDGEGAILIRNTAEKDSVWNIYLKFKETKDIDLVPEIFISSLKPQQTYIKKYTYKRPKALKPDIFKAITKCHLGVNLTRLKTLDRYNFELFFTNNSEFLIHLISFKIYEPSDLVNPIIEVKPHNLDIIRPNLDFRKTYEIETPLDPPDIIIKCEYTAQLVFEYLESSINLSEIQETPELEYDSAKSLRPSKPIIKQKIRDKNKGKIDSSDSSKDGDVYQKILQDPKIKKLDSEIQSLEEEEHEHILQMKIIRSSLNKKKDKRKKRVDMLLKEFQQDKEMKEKISKGIEQKKKEIEEIKEKQEELKKSEEKIKQIQQRIQQRKIIQETTNSIKTKSKSKKTQKKIIKKEPAKVVEKKKQPSKTLIENEEDLEKVKSLKEAETIAVFIKKNANKFIKAIEDKYTRLKRKTPEFMELYDNRKKLQNKTLVYFSLSAIKQLKTILRNDAADLKNFIIFRYFKGKLKEVYGKLETSSLKNTTLNVNKKDNDTINIEKRIQKKQTKRNKQNNIEKNLIQVQKIADSHLVKIHIKKNANKLQQAIQQKDKRLKRKVLAFSELVEMVPKFSEKSSLFVHKDVGIQLKIILKNEASDIAMDIELVYFKRKNNISKEKIDDFLSI